MKPAHLARRLLFVVGPHAPRPPSRGAAHMTPSDGADEVRGPKRDAEDLQRRSSRLLQGISTTKGRSAGSSESESIASSDRWKALRTKAGANTVFQAAGRRRTREHKHMLRPVSVVRVTWNLISTVWLVYLLVLV